MFYAPAKRKKSSYKVNEVMKQFRHITNKLLCFENTLVMYPFLTSTHPHVFLIPLPPIPLQDNRFVPGAGATEVELAHQLASYSETIPGLAQYAVKQYAQAFETMPKALAENAGVKATELLSKLYAAHQDGQKNAGFDIEVSIQ